MRCQAGDKAEGLTTDVEMLILEQREGSPAGGIDAAPPHASMHRNVAKGRDAREAPGGRRILGQCRQPVDCGIGGHLARQAEGLMGRGSQALLSGQIERRAHRINDPRCHLGADLGLVGLGRDGSGMGDSDEGGSVRDVAAPCPRCIGAPAAQCPERRSCRRKEDEALPRVPAGLAREIGQELRQPRSELSRQ